MLFIIYWKSIVVVIHHGEHIISIISLIIDLDLADSFSDLLKLLFLLSFIFSQVDIDDVLVIICIRRTYLFTFVFLRLRVLREQVHMKVLFFHILSHVGDQISQCVEFFSHLWRRTFGLFLVILSLLLFPLFDLFLFFSVNIRRLPRDDRGHSISCEQIYSKVRLSGALNSSLELIIKAFVSVNHLDLLFQDHFRLFFGVLRSLGEELHCTWLITFRRENRVLTNEI